MNLLIDIHCHLDHPQFNDVDRIVENAEKAGLTVILTNGVNPGTNRKALELARFRIVKAALGIYPKQLEIGDYPSRTNKFDADKEIRFIEKNKHKISAVGEIGLDGLVRDDIREQATIFEKLLKLAKKIDKPVIVHSRKAEKEVIEMLESCKQKKVLLHCFCGKKRLVKKAADLGYCFSIPTNVVRAQNFQILVKDVNINQLFCETDAPYLSPFRGNINEPAFVVESYRKIAEIKKMELQEVINNIWMNYQKLFS